jgi:hypothetical protein
MAATPSAITAPDSTDATFILLRQLRRGRARKQAVSLAYWLYLTALAVFVYGSWLVAAVVRALRHPPQPASNAVLLVRAEPAGLTALALTVIVFLLWDALWRGPVTVALPTADWLLATPVRRDRLLRPRYRASVLVTMLAGAVFGLVPAAILVAAGLGGRGSGHLLRLVGTAALGTGLLAGLGSGAAGLVEAHQASWHRLRSALPGAAAGLVALAALTAATAVWRLPSAIGTALQWSGPWGWAVQGEVGLAGGPAPLWALAMTILALTAGAVIVAGDRAAATVPASALRTRARAVGDMSAAAMSLDARSMTTAYRDWASRDRPASLRIRPPLLRQLVLPWRDLTALIRAPARLAWSVLLALASVAFAALAVRAAHSALLPLTGALSFGYLAAAGLSEGARLDADDPARSAQLPFRYHRLVWWHALVPCLVLAMLAGGPAVALALATGRVRLLGLAAVTIPVLVAGALLNAYRGPMPASLFAGFDTPAGNTAAVSIAAWYASGPLIAIAPMIPLLANALGRHPPGLTPQLTVIAAVLAAGMGIFAARRAMRLKSG